MNPKNKAKQLLEKSKKILDNSVCKSNAIAIDVSLFCVNEIIKATQRETINDYGDGIDIIPNKYWINVKNEINNLL